MENQKIVFINQSAGYLMRDIIEAFGKTNNELILCTSNIAIGEHLQKNNKLIVEELVKYNNNNTFHRLTTWCIAFVQLIFIIVTKYRNAHLFIVSNPPFAFFLPLILNNRFDLLVFDIYPDVLTKYKLFNKNSVVVKLWENVNKMVFKRADHIFTITDEMASRLNKYTLRKVQVVPLWGDQNGLTYIPKNENKFILENQLEGKFIVLYSGNMGKTNPINTAVNLAESLKHVEEIHFVLIGGGDQYNNIKQHILSKNLNNVSILEWQNKSFLSHTLSSADIAIVTIDEDNSDMSMPSKTFNLLVVGSPIMCIGPMNSALSKMISVNKIGQSFRKNETDSMISFIKYYFNNPIKLNELRNNSLSAAKKYSKNNAKKFVNL